MSAHTTLALVQPADRDDTDPITPADLDDNPRDDAEALLLCALLRAPTAAAAAITTALEPTDFHRPTYADLFTGVAELISAGQPHDPVSVMATLTRGGKAAGHTGERLRRALTDATLAGSDAVALTHYADIVLSQSYRRGFAAAATRLAQIAAEAPEDQLYELMCQLGREQRAATARLNTFRAG
ncbi:DnaB-like helicase N-terminal domain-containing protein [Rhodococcus sp. NPDC003318]|uniref:DnaB-like helicase N-terminal domain-containing protein n=1 Tax=Rhodococcus sp. NPDC003318 TaxID=3364503 RepID=UPI0036C933E7